MEYNGNDRKGDENTGHSLVPSNEERSIRAYSPTPDIIRAYPADDENPIHRYIDVLLRRKKVIIAFFAIVLVTTLIGTVTTEPVYKATAKVEISLENPKVVNFDQVVEVETQSAEFYETQYLLLKSKNLARQVVEKLNLAKHPEYNPEDQSPGIVDRIKSGIFGTISAAIGGVKNLFIRPAADSGSGGDEKGCD